MRAVIVGADFLGRKISRYLINFGYEVIFIDDSQETIRAITEDEGLAGIQGSATSLEVLRRVDLSRSDLFVATTSNDDLNIVACELARSLGSTKRIARLTKDDYIDPDWLNEARKGKLLSSATSVIATNVILAETIADILSYRQECVDKVYDLCSGKVKLVSLLMLKNLSFIGCTIQELYDKFFRFNLRVVGIYRRDQFLQDLQSQTIQESDLVYVMIESTELSEFLMSINNRVSELDNNIMRIATGTRYHNYNYVSIIGDHMSIPQLVSTLLADPKVRINVITNNRQLAEKVLNNLKHAENDKVGVILSNNIENKISEIYPRYGEDFIIMNNEDKESIYCALLCTYAKLQNISCVLNDSSYTRLVRTMNVTHIYTVDSYIMQPILEATKAPYENAVYLLRNDYQVVEQLIVKGSAILGKSVSEVNRKYGSKGLKIVGCSIHASNIVKIEDEQLFAEASDSTEHFIYLKDDKDLIINEGDILIFLIDYEYIKQADELLSSFID